MKINVHADGEWMQTLDTMGDATLICVVEKRVEKTIH